MSVGENIRKQREAKGFTQKELADKLFVTPQAISRWEKGSVEPSVETLKSMSVLFGVTIDDLVLDKAPENSENKPEQPAVVVVPVPAPAPTPEETIPTPAPAPKLLGVCVRCGKAIYEGDQFGYGTKNVSHHGKRHHERIGYSLTADGAGHDLFCQNCVDDINAAIVQATADHAAAIDSRRKKAWGWGIFAGIVAFAIAIIIGIALLKNNSQSAGVWTLCLSPVMAYLLFSLTFVLIVDNTFVSEVFMEIVSFAFVKMPGVIFSLDFDGIAFLIAVKLLFAILSFLIFAAVLALAVAISGIFSMFMFPVALKREPGII
jgi:transcriptional regulator with XRE-family HTH domain